MTLPQFRQFLRSVLTIRSRDFMLRTAETANGVALGIAAVLHPPAFSEIDNLTKKAMD